MKGVTEPNEAPGVDSDVVPRPGTADVSHQILALIRRSNLRVGDRLPTEAETAHVLGLSRQKVRAGFLSLESQGILRSRQGSGRVLLDRTHHTLSGLLGPGIRHSKAELLDAVLARVSEV